MFNYCLNRVQTQPRLSAQHIPCLLDTTWSMREEPGKQAWVCSHALKGNRQEQVEQRGKCGNRMISQRDLRLTVAAVAFLVAVAVVVVAVADAVIAG